MLLIPTHIAPSAIEGNGLVAAAAIPAGQPVWRFQTGFDQAFPPAAVAALPRPSRDHLKRYAWIRREDGHAILSGDHACFMNHSDSPNTGVPPGVNDPEVTVALRDIATGEELTCDYRAFDAAASEKLCASGWRSARGGDAPSPKVPAAPRRAGGTPDFSLAR